jgi:hypothetical protein
MRANHSHQALFGDVRLFAQRAEADCRVDAVAQENVMLLGFVGLSYAGSPMGKSRADPNDLAFSPNQPSRMTRSF